MSSADRSLKTPLERRLDPLREPFFDFIKAQTTAGALLVIAMALALLLCNLGMYERYEAVRSLELGMYAGSWHASGSLLYWTNHALIAVFFFVIGLEIKRELLAGELQEPGKRRMLIAAAAGGMLAPALIYTAFNLWLPGGTVGGWGIPMATDTALAIGVLAMLGPRLVPGVAAFLVGLAIIDDIGAIIVIALAYTESLHILALLAAGGLVCGGLLLNHAGVRHPLLYGLVGALTWVALHHAGVHASVAGVLVAATVPARPRIAPMRLLTQLRRRVAAIEPEADVLADPTHHERIQSVAAEAREATTPLRRWEHGLDLPVALLILPMFVFLNAGVVFSADLIAEAAADPVTLGVVLGLVLGKPLGIVGATLLALRVGFGHLPANIGIRHVAGVGLLAGIGFTMSTFIAGLALPEEQIDKAKIAILSASSIAGVLGYLTLRAVRSSTSASANR